MRYRFIKTHADTWPVTLMCGVLGVTSSGYYAGIKRPNSRRLVDDDRFAPMIRRIFEQHRGNYGAPRITEELRALGQRLNRKRVERLMREMGLRAKQKRKFRPHTTVVDPEAMISPNLLEQDFTAEAPNQRWVGDITYLETTEGFEYLATVYPSDKQAFSPADVTMMEGCPPASLKSSSAHHRVVGVAVASE